MLIKKLLQTTTRFGNFQHLKTAYEGHRHIALGYQSTRWVSQNAMSKNLENYQQYDSFLLQKQLDTDEHNDFSCFICYQPFSTSYFPLSVRSKRSLKDGASVCVGCRR